MASKLVIFSVLVSFAVVQGAKLSTNENTEIVSKERGGRILEIPFLGLLVWKFSNIVWPVLSKVLGFVGWKLPVVTLVAAAVINGALWAYNLSNFFSVALGVGMFGFCKITGKCSRSNISTGLAEAGDNLYYAAKNLYSGMTLYDNSI